MFEDYRRAPRSGRPRPAALIALAISLLIHGALIFFIYHSKITVKILTFGPQVRNVAIVPPPPSGPKIVGPPQAGARQGGFPSAGAAGTPGSGQVRRERPPATAPPPASPQAGSASAEKASAGGPAVPALSSKFQESLSSRFKSGGESDLKITLGPPGSKPRFPGGTTGTAKGTPPDFYQYIAGGGAGGGGGAGPHRGPGSGFGSGQRAAMTIPLKGYDLVPWARGVLDAIQRNWTIPPAGRQPGTSRLKLFAVIRKDGDISSMEILETSSLEILDQAALKALRASLPFPALPADFPADFLEVFFEFIYE